MAAKVKTAVTTQTYSAADISAYLGISLVAAYNLLNANDMPSFRIGRRILIRRDAFEQWLGKQTKQRLG